MTKPVLILGGGINGAAVARELALNGVSVWLVDRADLNAGATAGSTRLIHGGLRYLEYAEFDLVRESLEERNRLLRLAPDFIKPLKLYIPVSGRLGGVGTTVARFLRLPNRWTPAARARGLWLVRAGLRFYDQFAGTSTLPAHSVHARGEPNVPALGETGCRWLCAYYDAQILWPERFVIGLLRDAQRAAVATGAELRVFTHTAATLNGDTVDLRPAELIPVGDNHFTRGAVIETLQPSAIINATGAWVDHTLNELRVASRRLMRGTQGSHLVSFHPGLRASLGDGGVYAEAPDGRPIFVLPFGTATLIGTTDLPFEGDPAEAVASASEVDYLLEAVGQLIPQAALTRQDVTLHYSGVRPLPDVSAASTAAVTRRHWLEPQAGGAVPIYSIIGGKLTTCRSLAEQAAATILKQLDRAVVATSRDRPITDELGDASVADLSASELPAAEVLQRLIRDEWVERLEDLVERRLMLHFRPELRRAMIDQLAEVLVELGRLSDAQKPVAVERCVARLKQHYGRAL